MFTDVPSAPVNVHATNVSRDSCVINWQAPASDGGSAVTGYVIERRTGFGSSWVKCATVTSLETSCVFYDLLEGTTYEYQVRAENRTGLSQAGVTSAFVARRASAPPAAPARPTANDVTAHSCQLTWRAPADDGGDEIQGYVVEFRPVGSTRFQRVSDVYGVRTPLTQTRVTSLDNDEEFEFRVAAVNRAGVGEWSPLSQVVKTRKPDGKN